jgi:putative Mn2+ efflux pump MntP
MRSGYGYYSLDCDRSRDGCFCSFNGAWYDNSKPQSCHWTNDGKFFWRMPVLGWLAGLSFIDLISGFDHWVAFGLLAFIGGRMIYSARANPKEEKEAKLTASVLLILSVATSIDALAVGLSFSLLRVSIITPVILIGVVTFLLSLTGFSFGNKIGKFFKRKVQAIGGIVLIAIGIKILLEHLLI